MDGQKAGTIVLREAAGAGQISSLAKGIAILDCIVGSDRPLRSQDIANHFALDRSTAYRFLMTLEGLGLVAKDARSKTYSAGPRFLLWQRSQASNRGLVALARPEVEGLARITGQTAHLAVLQGSDVELVEVAPSGGTVVVRQAPGDREALYCTAVGKAILAFLPVLERQALMHQMQFRPFTGATIVTLDALDAELGRIAAGHVAFDDGEGSPLVTCIAVPVIDDRGYPVGSLGISAVRGTYPGAITDQVSWVTAVQAASHRVSKQLAGMMSPTPGPSLNRVSGDDHKSEADGLPAADNAPSHRIRKRVDIANPV